MIKISILKEGYFERATLLLEVVETYLKQRVDKRTLIFVMRLRFKIKTNLVLIDLLSVEGEPRQNVNAQK